MLVWEKVKREGYKNNKEDGKAVKSRQTKPMNATWHGGQL